MSTAYPYIEDPSDPNMQPSHPPQGMPPQPPQQQTTVIHVHHHGGN